MNEKFTHRSKVTITLLLLVVIMLALLQSWRIGICREDDITCAYEIGKYGAVLFPILPIFVISLITYFMRREVYKAWLIATAVWLPVMFFFTYLVANEGGSLGFGDMYSGLVLVGVYAFYLVLSVLTIAIKYFVLWRKERNP